MKDDLWADLMAQSLWTKHVDYHQRRHRQRIVRAALLIVGVILFVAFMVLLPLPTP